MSLPLSCHLGLEMTSGLHLWRWNIIFALNFFVKMTNTMVTYQLLWALKREVLFTFVIVREIIVVVVLSGFWIIVCTWYAENDQIFGGFYDSPLPHLIRLWHWPKSSVLLDIQSSGRPVESISSSRKIASTGCPVHSMS